MSADKVFIFFLLNFNFMFVSLFVKTVCASCLNWQFNSTI
ncbi:hypothetical protein PRUB_b0206 [Pseudoalteromonas rubra]|uniref:Uncharacterized protein n=1 Tax=Pseudoalteromonas rubra TaxID=43658 RepID=A0A8T0BYB7_9GAMM|nr:hypothetical protein PRUB_b0206 [Pseudoalteromonas rubra]